MEKLEKITVAFFLPSLDPGGTERNVVNLVNNINREKYAVSLVLGSMEGDFISKIHRDIPIMNLNAPYSLGLFLKLIHYFKTKKPDIFVSAFPRINVICVAAKVFSGVKTNIIITEHSVFSLLPVIAKTSWRRFVARCFMPLLATLFYPKADAIICVSEGIAKDLATIFHYSKKMQVVYNPIIDETIYGLAQEPVSHPWFLDKTTPIILTAARLVECKDYPTLLKSFSILAGARSAKLVILGRGPEKEKLASLAGELGITGSVDFLGFQENPFKYMKNSSVFVSSSLQEGFGNAIIEAMACGAPVVSTDCPTGPGEIITDGKDGLLVPMQHPESMASAIARILDDTKLSEVFSANGKARAEFFSVKRSVGEYERVFRELIQ